MESIYFKKSTSHARGLFAPGVIKSSILEVYIGSVNFDPLSIYLSVSNYCPYLFSRTQSGQHQKASAGDFISVALIRTLPGALTYTLLINTCVSSAKNDLSQGVASMQHYTTRSKFCK